MRKPYGDPLAAAAISLLLLSACGRPDETVQSKQPEVSMTQHTDAVQPIVQLVIDLPQLQQFLHPELPDRKPLVLIQTDEVSPGLALKKFGQPVAIRELRTAENAPYLRLTQLEITGAKAHVRLEYPVEGVKGEADLEQRDGEWRVVKSRIWER